MTENGIKELLWFVGIFIAFGVLWFITGGAQSVLHSVVNPSVTSSSGTVGEASQGGLFGNSSNGTGAANNTVYVSGFTFASSSSPSSSGTGSTGSSVSYDQSQYAWITNKSPYFKEITLNTDSISTTNPSQEYIKLSSYSGNSTPIIITGWRLLSLSSGATATIGNGVILPYVGGTSVAQPISLAPGDTAYVITGTSPIGVSFQENECSGYFSQFNSFNPSLNYSCPSIDQDLPQAPNQLNDQCLDYLQSYPECKTQTQALPPSLSPSCQTFITNNANYAQCIIDHKSDKNFYSHEWWIYLGRGQSLWKSEREEIELLDQNGNVVDVLSY